MFERLPLSSGQPYSRATTFPERRTRRQLQAVNGLFSRLVEKLRPGSYTFRPVRARQKWRPSGSIGAGVDPRQRLKRMLTASCCGDMVGRSLVDASNPASMPSITPMAIS